MWCFVSLHCTVIRTVDNNNIFYCYLHKQFVNLTQDMNNIYNRIESHFVNGKYIRTVRTAVAEITAAVVCLSGSGIWLWVQSTEGLQIWFNHHNS